MLLEREGLLESLADRLAKARGGSGSLILVAGEAGAGKTALVRAFADTRADSTLVLLGACDPLTTPRPLSPLHDFSEDLPGLDLDRDPLAIFSDVLERVRHTIRPVLMIVEDIHWADAATLDFLRYMGRRVADSKAVLVCTYRDDEVGHMHPARQVLGQLIPLRSTHRLQVPALSLNAVTRLAEESPLDPEDLLRLTDGNAFFVTEVLASGGRLPTTVQEAVLARVAQLDSRARRVVEGVSVAPRSLEIAHAAAIADASLDDVDAALSAGVLVGEGHQLRFRHELARAAVEDGLPAARRLGLHVRMLEILEGAAPPDLARIAHHAIRAGRSDLVIEHSPRAAAEAAKRGSPREAVAFYKAALEHSDALGEEKTAFIRLRLADELRFLEEMGAAEDELRLAIDYLRAVGAVEELADALGKLQGVLWYLRRIDEGWPLMEEAIQILRPGGPSEMLAFSLYRAAHSHMVARRAEPAFSVNAEARQMAEQVGSERVQFLTLMIEGANQIVMGDATEGARLLREAVVWADRSGNDRYISVILNMFGSGAGEARLYDEALAILERELAHDIKLDADANIAYARAWQARIAFEQGRWDDTVTYAEIVDRTTGLREGMAHITALSALGRVRVRRGDPGGVELLERMTAIASEHEVQHGWNAVCGRAEHFWLADRPEVGVAELESTFLRALETDSPWGRGELGFWMWRTGRIGEPPDGAAEPFALQMSGEWKKAADAWRRIGCPYEVALALADGPTEAQLEAISILDRLGARPLGDRIRNRLRSQGIDRVPSRPTDRTLSNPAGLTDRQVEVLGLLADGYGNEEIASRLYISKKTVEHHVSAIFTKLGVSSRAEAARSAARVGTANGGPPASV